MDYRNAQVKKLNIVHTGRFVEISQRIKRRIELITELSRIFAFSEPTPIDAPPPNVSTVLNISPFEFCEPLSRFDDEKDITEELVKMTSMMNISNSDRSSIHRQSDSPFNIVPDKEVTGKETNFQMSVSEVSLTIPIECVRKHVDLNSANVNTLSIEGVHLKTPLDRERHHHNQEHSGASSDHVSNETAALSAKRNIRNREDSKVDKNIDKILIELDNWIENCTNNENLIKGDGNIRGTNSRSSNNELDSSFKIDSNELCEESSNERDARTTNVYFHRRESKIGVSDQVNQVPTGSIWTKTNERKSVTVNSSVEEGNIDVYNGVDSTRREDDCDNEVVTANDTQVNEEISTAEVGGAIDKMTKCSQISIETNRLGMSLSDGPLCQNVSEENMENNQTKLSDLDPNTQVTHLDIDNNKQIPQPARPFDKQPLPLLVKHIHTITWPNQEEIFIAPAMQLFGQTFETVMVYGLVTSLNVENGGLIQRFVIDDGSGSINVVWKANKQITDVIANICKLDDEVKACQQSGLSVMNENWQPNSNESKEILDSFNQIIRYTRRHITKRTKLKLFGYAAVVGKPMRPPGRGIVSLYSNFVEDDSGADRSLELYYKKTLIRLYEEKYS